MNLYKNINNENKYKVFLYKVDKEEILKKFTFSKNIKINKIGKIIVNEKRYFMDHTIGTKELLTDTNIEVFKKSEVLDLSGKLKLDYLNCSDLENFGFQLFVFLDAFKKENIVSDNEINKYLDTDNFFDNPFREYYFKMMTSDVEFQYQKINESVEKKKIMIKK